MACIKKINGCEIKDETARKSIEEMRGNTDKSLESIAAQVEEMRGNTNTSLAALDSRVTSLAAMHPANVETVYTYEPTEGVYPKVEGNIQSTGAKVSIFLTFEGLRLMPGDTYEFYLPEGIAPFGDEADLDCWQGAILGGNTEPSFSKNDDLVAGVYGYLGGESQPCIGITNTGDLEISSEYGTEYVRVSGVFDLSRVSVAELVDLRTDANGKTYPTAGEAVRALERKAATYVGEYYSGAGAGSFEQKPDAQSWAPDGSQKEVIEDATIQKDVHGEILVGAYGAFSSELGGKSQANGKRAHAEGTSTIASGNYSHSEGNKTFAKGVNSHAEGLLTAAIGDVSHSEGSNTRAIGEASHSEGAFTESTGYASHAEGDHNKASGNGSHAGGVYSESNHETSFVHGAHLKTGRANQAVFGEYNEIDENALFAVGCGNSETERKNAFQVEKDGSIRAFGKKIGNVFIAEHGVTTYDEIIEAVNAGMACFCMIREGEYKGIVIPLSYIESMWCIFSTIRTMTSPGSVGMASEVSVWCIKGSGWQNPVRKSLAYQ